MAILARMPSGLPQRLAVAILAAALAACDAAPPSPSSSTSPGESGIPATPGPSTAACVGEPVDAGESATRWSDRVFYEVFVRSFSDSDGDGTGDLAGLTAKLDYLNDGDAATGDDLGITGIWLMPIAESKSYHGYDVLDYTAVEQDYGDEAALKAFVAAAHQRGIEVIVDFVINHTSSDHPWFKDALAGGEHRDWYIWSDTDSGWPAVAGPNPWHASGNGDFFYGAFFEGMPDLNLRNPDVTAEIKRIAGVWLDDFGVDGFRIDAAKHLIEIDRDHQANTQETMDWLADFSAFVHASHPDALVLGEVYDVSRSAGAYVPDSVDLTFDFGLASAEVTALQRGRTPPIKTALEETLRFWPPNAAASFLTNHDQNRVMSALNGDTASAHLAAFMLLTGPGVPFIYYGEELGLDGSKPDERIRTPMPWTADAPGAGFTTGTPWESLADNALAVSVAGQTDDAAGLLSTYRDAIRVREKTAAFREGRTFVVDGGTESVIGWLRTTSDQTMLVVVNVGAAAVTDYGLTLGSGPLCGVTGADLAWSVGDGSGPAIELPAITAKGGLDAYQPLGTLQPRSGYVIRLDVTR